MSAADNFFAFLPFDEGQLVKGPIFQSCRSFPFIRPLLLIIRLGFLSPHHRFWLSCVPLEHGVPFDFFFAVIFR